MDYTVIRKLRTIVLTLTLAGGSLLSGTLGGCAGAAAKDILTEASRGTVDAADYTVWRSNFGAGLSGDYNGDGRVDAADYLVWK